MPLTNPARQLDDAPIANIARLLLRQFKTLLEARGQTLTNEGIQHLCDDIAAHRPVPPELRHSVRDLVEESIALLNERWGLTFAQSLSADMGAIGGWETTEEFLDIANEKSNAELRISAGAALLVLMGEKGYAPYLYQVIEDDGGVFDVDATIARRALLHAARLSPDTPDALQRARALLLG